LTDRHGARIRTFLRPGSAIRLAPPEAPGRGGEPRADARALRARVAELLRAAAAAEGVLRRGAGVGRLFEFRVAGGRGAALAAEGQVVHAALF